MDSQAVAIFFVRKFAIWLGGILVTAGVLKSSDMAAWTGAIVTIGTLIWAWWEQQGQALALKKAERAYEAVVAQINALKAGKVPFEKK